MFTKTAVAHAAVKLGVAVVASILAERASGEIIGKLDNALASVSNSTES